MSETPYADSISRSLRRITRALDLFSRRLAVKHSLTVPQLVCLRQIIAMDSASPGELARQVSLSQATVTGILDRLENRGLIERRRDQRDRRRVTLWPTDEGRRLAATAPEPLQERFATRLEMLPPHDQAAIDECLSRIAEMMEAPELEESSMLEHAATVEFDNAMAPSDQGDPEPPTRPPVK